MSLLNLVATSIIECYEGHKKNLHFYVNCTVPLVYYIIIIIITVRNKIIMDNRIIQSFLNFAHNFMSLIE